MAEVTPPPSPVDAGDADVAEPHSPATTSAPTEASTPGSSSDTTVGELLALTAANPVSGLDTRITALKKERERMKTEKRDLAKALRSNERKRARLKSKAKALSSTDLLEVLQFRAQDQSKVAANKKAKTEKGATK